eukprot:545454-Amorphochlora_amoeboformis.AAC.1
MLSLPGSHGTCFVFVQLDHCKPSSSANVWFLGCSWFCVTFLLCQLDHFGCELPSAAATSMLSDADHSPLPTGNSIANLAKKDNEVGVFQQIIAKLTRLSVDC